MRVLNHGTGIELWASARDTYDWAHKIGGAWPCSTLSDKRFYAAFDDNGLLGLTVNGRDEFDVDAHELSACAADLIEASGKVSPDNNTAYFVAVGQFLES